MAEKVYHQRTHASVAQYITACCMVVVVLCNIAFIIILAVSTAAAQNRYDALVQAQDPNAIESLRSILIDAAYMVHTARLTIQEPTPEQVCRLAPIPRPRPATALVPRDRAPCPATALVPHTDTALAPAHVRAVSGYG